MSDFIGSMDEARVGGLRANGFWKFTIVQWRGVGISFNSSFMHNFVDLIGGNSWSDGRRSNIENLPGKLYACAYDRDRGHLEG